MPLLMSLPTSLLIDSNTLALIALFANAKKKILPETKTENVMSLLPQHSTSLAFGLVTAVIECDKYCASHDFSEA